MIWDQIATSQSLFEVLGGRPESRIESLSMFDCLLIALVSRVETVEKRHHDKTETNVDDLVQRMSAWQSNVNVDTNDRGKTHNINKCFVTNHLL